MRRGERTESIDILRRRQLLCLASRTTQAARSCGLQVLSRLPSGAAGEGRGGGDEAAARAAHVLDNTGVVVGALQEEGRHGLGEGQGGVGADGGGGGAARGGEGGGGVGVVVDAGTAAHRARGLVSGIVVVVAAESGVVVGRGQSEVVVVAQVPPQVGVSGGVLAVLCGGVPVQAGIAVVVRYGRVAVSR